MMTRGTYKRTPETLRKLSLSQIGRYAEAKNGQWKGDDVGYGALHDWVRLHYGNATKCEADNCAGISTVYEWANLSREYHRRRDDFKMMCRSCHRIYDKRKPVCSNGHLITKLNSRFSGTHRNCKDCDREYYQNKTKPKLAAITGKED